MILTGSLQRIFSVARKEAVHIRRDPTTFFFALALPLVEMFMLGYAIDTNVRHIRTVVLDLCKTQQTDLLLRSFVNSEDFNIIGSVDTEDELNRAIISGRAKVGILIPENYSRRLEMGETAQILIKVDGSESSVAGEAVNVGNAIALQESLKMVLGQRQMPIETRPQILFLNNLPDFFFCLV